MRMNLRTSLNFRQHRQGYAGLLLAVALSTTTVQADTLAGGEDILGGSGDNLLSDQDTTLIINQAERSQFSYGRILFDFYCNRYYSSANQILAAEAEHVFRKHSADTDLLLGNIYSQINMPEYADEMYSKIIEQDTLSSIKQQTWLGKGELYYKRGQLQKAEAILKVPRQSLTQEQDVERRVFLSTIYLDEGHADKASSILGKIPVNTRYSAFALYNAGVANLRQGHVHEGIGELEKIIHTPVGDAEVNAIKDRASLALAYQALRDHKPDKARSYLLHIRIDGPFSNQALLAMGYVHFSQWNYRKALAFWLELIKRNPADPSVQEALMLAPRAYEELHAYPEALFGYHLAAQIFRAELKRLGYIEYISTQPGWIDSLDVYSQDTSQDPFAPIDTLGFAQKPEASFLYHLFSRHDFNLTFADYIQTGHLIQQIERQQSELPAVLQIASIHQQDLHDHLHEWSQQMDLLSKRNDELQNEFRILRKRMQSYSEESSFTDNASYADVNRLQLMQHLEQSINQLPPSVTATLFRERIRRIKGVILWQVAHNAPLAFEQARMDITEMSTTMQVLQQRIDGIHQLLTDSQQFMDHYSPARFADVQHKMLHDQDDLGHQRSANAGRLLAMTRQTIADEQTFLNHQLASALLAVARLQDMTASRQLSNGLPGNRP